MNRANQVVISLTISFLSMGCFNSEPDDQTNPNEPLQINPWVQITYPAQWSAVFGLVEIRIEAGPAEEIQSVVLFIDGLPVDTLEIAPYSYSWNTNSLSGDHTLFARSFWSGQYLDSPLITVSVLDTSDTEPPYVRITSPPDWTVVQGIVTVYLEASDNEALDRIEVLVNGSLAATLTALPYNWDWNVAGLPETNYTLLCRAFDLSGNQGLSNLVNVTVENH